MRKFIVLLILIIPIRVNAISASSYIVMDSDNNRVLEGANIHKKSLIASITKIMTSMVVINNGSLDKIVTIGDEVLRSFGSGIYVSVGEKIKKEELLYGLMLRSGNDAAYTLAFDTGGSMEGFARMMNSLANSIGMNDTVFVNSSGLEDSYGENYSTVYDMALLSSYAIKNEEYKKIVGTKDITVKTDLKTYVWHNKNRLLSSYKYCIGGKTGFTEKARRTLVTNASKNNINLTVVTFNDGNDFNDHKDLYEKYFNKLKSYHLLYAGPIKTKYSDTYLENDYFMSLTSSESNKVELVIDYYKSNVTNIIGTVNILLDGEVYHQENIIRRSIPKKENNVSIWEKIKRKIKSLW